jgi:hypothetical protein
MVNRICPARLKINQFSSRKFDLFCAKKVEFLLFVDDYARDIIQPIIRYSTNNEGKITKIILFG